MTRILLFLTLLITLAGGSAYAQERRTYAYGSDSQQQLDLYRLGTSVAQPVIVMLHGGAWRTGDKANRSVWEAKAAYWLPRGYTFVSVNTRLLPNADPIAQTMDLSMALAFLQRNHASLGLDPDRFILMGHSAGAHVAALFATREDLRRAAGARLPQGVILLDSAVLDVETSMANRPPRLYRRAFGDDPAYWRATSPQAHLDRSDGRFLIVCSSQRASPCPAARSFATQAAAAGLSASVLPVAMSHGDINTNLGEAPQYTAAVDRWISETLR